MKYYTFENQDIAVPILYDDVLREEFGDYMKVVRGAGADHPYPVYIVQQKILLDHLSEHPDEALRQYILNTADRHSEDYARCTEILDMFDQVVDTIKNSLSGDVASCISLLDGVSTLLDTLTETILNDYSSKVRVIETIEKIKEQMNRIIEQLRDGSMNICVFDDEFEGNLALLRTGVNELYNGQDPIDCIE